MRSKRRKTRESKATLAWAAVLVIVAQVAFNVMLDTRLVEVRDPEYGYRLAALRARLTESPDRALVLVFGSSRTAAGLAPEIIDPPLESPTGRSPLLFSFPRGGSGPLMQLVYLRRILAEGIRPDWLLLEILPPSLYTEFNLSDGKFEDVSFAGIGDLPVLAGYVKPGRLVFDWVRLRLKPWHAYRHSTLAHFAPEYVTGDTYALTSWRSFEPLGGAARDRAAGSAVARSAELERARKQYADAFDHFGVSDRADQAIREVLRLSRARGISVALFLMPEADDFRRFYALDSVDVIEEYLTVVTSEFHIPIVDARDWIDDAKFADGHHLTTQGAEEFTRRFASEAIEPLLAGKWRYEVPTTKRNEKANLTTVSRRRAATSTRRPGR